MIKAGAMKKGLNLAEQYLIDCAYMKTISGAGQARGCNGAHPMSYPKYMVSIGGHLPHENSYKYLGTSPKLNCKSAPKKMWNSGAKVSKTLADWKCNESKLKSLIYSKGAVSVSVYATKLRNYKTGVYTGCSSVKEGNHQVLAVGWGTENGKKYWLVKNSWGTNWGEKGYFKIERGSNIQNTNGKTGMCGIEEVSVLTLSVGLDRYILKDQCVQNCTSSLIYVIGEKVEICNCIPKQISMCVLGGN